MKFWLACFVLLFLGAELFQWFAALEVGQPSGAWLILGGMGLAAASNAAHLPKLRMRQQEDAMAQPSKGIAAPAEPNQQPTQKEDPQPSTKPLSVAEQSAEDSISFKVRLPWR
jgi:hypothetical protein